MAGVLAGMREVGAGCHLLLRLEWKDSLLAGYSSPCFSTAHPASCSPLSREEQPRALGLFPLWQLSAASLVDRKQSKWEGMAILTIHTILLPKVTACFASAWGEQKSLDGCQQEVWHLHQVDTKSWLVCSWRWGVSRAGWDLLIFCLFISWFSWLFLCICKHFLPVFPCLCCFPW